MNSHITKFLETVYRLKAIGSEFSNSQNYRTLITAFGASLKEVLNPEYIQCKLVYETINVTIDI